MEPKLSRRQFELAALSALCGATGTPLRSAVAQRVQLPGEVPWLGETQRPPAPLPANAPPVRSLMLGSESRVDTLVGTGLFDFGDVDGIGDDVRLQHPLALAWLNGLLYVCDTYNHKIKVVDPRSRQSATFAGTGHAGDEDGTAASFWEPGGITAERGRLFVADTNNHRIRVVELTSRSVTTLRIVET